MKRNRTRAFLQMKRPIPSHKMPSKARKLWYRIVHLYPPGWFDGAPLKHLEIYCQMTVLADRAMDVALREHGSQRKQRRAITTATRMAKCALTWGDALRIGEEVHHVGT